MLLSKEWFEYLVFLVSLANNPMLVATAGTIIAIVFTPIGRLLYHGSLDFSAQAPIPTQRRFGAPVGLFDLYISSKSIGYFSSTLLRRNNNTRFQSCGHPDDFSTPTGIVLYRNPLSPSLVSEISLHFTVACHSTLFAVFRPTIK